GDLRTGRSPLRRWWGRRELQLRRLGPTQEPVRRSAASRRDEPRTAERPGRCPAITIRPAAGRRAGHAQRHDRPRRSEHRQAMPGNPYASSTDQVKRRVIAYGMRNQFRFAFRPGTRELWVGDVGWNQWEEINRIPDATDGTVENFGWPCYEGAQRQAGYDGADLNLCESLYSTGQQAPYYAYDHDDHVVPGDSCPTGNSSVSGIAFESDSNYPSAYAGALFFADSTRGCIWTMQRGTN